jgi:hypothetical protein
VSDGTLVDELVVRARLYYLLFYVYDAFSLASSWVDLAVLRVEAAGGEFCALYVRFYNVGVFLPTNVVLPFSSFISSSQHQRSI